MGKIIILHGRQSIDETNTRWPQNTRHWLGWLKDECIKLGYKTYNPLIPKDWEVEYSVWKKTIEDLDKEISIDKDTILIWTSAWAWFFVRWLWETKKEVWKLILVAPAKKVPKYKENEFDFKNKFWDFEIDESIKDRVWEIIIFTSDTENEKLRADAKMYSQKFDCKLIELPWRWHFVISHNPINNKIPEVLEYLKD